jgi:hypothetical protein
MLGESFFDGNSWVDDYGHPLGAWEEIDSDEYYRVYRSNKHDLSVFLAHTTAFQAYTEWGIITDGEDTPLIASNVFKLEPKRTAYARFVLHKERVDE